VLAARQRRSDAWLRSRTGHPASRAFAVSSCQ
jgi:hypothetical protein